MATPKETVPAVPVAVPESIVILPEFDVVPAALPEVRATAAEFVDAAAPDPVGRGGVGGVVDTVAQAPRKIQSTIQRSLTIDGAVKNIAAIAKLTVNNPLNQGIRDLRKEIGTRMFKAATEAIDLTAATAIVALAPHAATFSKG